MLETRLQELLGDLTREERAINLKYLIKLQEMRQDSRIDWDGIELDGQHYKTIHYHDWNEAYLYALGRTITNLRRGVTDIYCAGTESAIEGDIQGMAGEVCAANFYRTDFERNIKLESAKKYDIIVKGHTIDIKTSLKRNSFSEFVVVSQTKHLGDSSYYFFARRLNDGKRQVINLKGWLHESEVVLENNRRDGFKGYWIKAASLRPFTNKESK